MRSALTLAVFTALLSAVLVAPVPVLDEESYLAIAAQLDPARPYDWWRPWPPWNGDREADAFVYAHPPLFLWWVWLVGQLTEAVSWAGRLAGLPWAALLGGSVGWLAQRLCRRPWLAGVVWLSAPVVVLSIQRGLMPDLMVTALLTAAVAAWVGERWALAGVALAAAVGTKYPALVMLLPLLFDALARRQLRKSWPMWAVFTGIMVAGEGWLAMQYGRVHLLEVLTRAGEIPRGAGDGRLLGVLVRMSLIGPVVLFLLPPGRRWVGIPAMVGAGVCFALARPPAMMQQQGALLALSIAGALPVVAAVFAVRRGLMTGGRELLLGAWALAVIVGVAGGHNFSAARYLLPAAAPLALLLVTALETRRSGRLALLLGAGAWGVLAAVLTEAEHRYAAAADSLAVQVIERWPEGGYFTGEWTFRWRMEQAGWQFYTGDAPPGAILAAPLNASPGPLPEGWAVLDRLAVPGTPGLRVVSSPDRIGLYSETLGAVPWGTAEGPLEEVVVWTVR